MSSLTPVDWVLLAIMSLALTVFAFALGYTACLRYIAGRGE